MSVEFRFASLDDYPRISAFLDQHWAKGHIYTRMPSLFDWTFRRHGHWEKQSYSFSIAEDSSDLVGLLGGIPFTLNILGRGHKAIWIVNYVLRSDYRKGVTALKLLSSFPRTDFFAIVAFGINPATAGIYQVLRGQVLPDIPRHFIVLPGKADRMKRLLHITYPDWSEERRASLTEAFEASTIQVYGSPVYNSIPEHWDERDWPEFASISAGAVRDSEYLTWRYRQHPVFEYSFIGIPDGRRTGLAVWRLETIRHQLAAHYVDVDRIGRLVEFLPTSAANAENLYAAFLQAVDAAGAMCADYYGYHGALGRWLHEFGLRRTDSHPDGAALPSRFQPLDQKGGSIASAVFLDTAAPPVVVDGDCRWYWTKSDSDQDRPN